MEFRMEAKLQKAIADILKTYAKVNPDFYIHESLAEQMAQAAARVFDASMDGQESRIE